MMKQRNRVLLRAASVVAGIFPAIAVGQLPAGGFAGGGGPILSVAVLGGEGLALEVTDRMVTLSGGGQSFELPPADEGMDSDSPLPGLGDDQGSAGGEGAAQPTAAGTVRPATETVDSASTVLISSAINVSDALTDVVDAVALVADGEQDPASIPGELAAVGDAFPDGLPSDGGGGEVPVDRSAPGGGGGSLPLDPGSLASAGGGLPVDPASLAQGGGSLPIDPTMAGGSSSLPVDPISLLGGIGLSIPGQGGGAGLPVDASSLGAGNDQNRPPLGLALVVSPVTVAIDGSVANAGNAAITQTDLLTNLIDAMAAVMDGAQATSSE